MHVHMLYSISMNGREEYTINIALNKAKVGEEEGKDKEKEKKTNLFPQDRGCRE